MKIVPSLLSADFSRLGDEVRRVEEAGADMIHFDVMDGRFVPNITFGPLVVEALRDKTRLPFDVHLMVEDPDRFVRRFAEAGADILTVHAEATTNLRRTVENVRAQEVKAGVSLNPDTSLRAVEGVLEGLDMVLIMTVRPGFGGQDFIPATLPKIRSLRRMVEERGLAVDIEVDGGINVETAPLVVEAGANVLVAGTAIFGQPDFRRVIRNLRRAVAAVKRT